MAGIRVPIDQLISQVADLMPDIDISQEVDKIIRYAFIFERQIGTLDGALEHKECVLDIDNYRAQLPRDFFKINAVKTGKNQFAKFSGTSFYMFNKNSPFLANRGDCFEDLTLAAPFYYGEITYQINDNYLNISKNIPKVGVSYEALPLDKTGLPTVNELHLYAGACFCRWKILSVRYFTGKLPENIYANAKLEWEEEKNRARYVDDQPTTDEVNYLGQIFSSAYHSRNVNQTTDPFNESYNLYW